MQNEKTELEIFYFFFGLLRQSIATAEPRIVAILLNKNHSERFDS